MNYTVEEIETRRLGHLEQQAALSGPQTDPAILIEIAELKHKARNNVTDGRRAFVTTLDFQFVMDVVAAALVRLGSVEATLANNDKRRLLRQAIHDGWMLAMTVIVVITLILQLRGH
jgi:hypothetical protein